VADVVVRAGNPLDLPEEELDPLVDAIARASGQTTTLAIVEQRGFAVTWWQVVLIYVGAKTTDAIISQIASAAVK
jgi:hypothetical protein